MINHPGSPGIFRRGNETGYAGIFDESTRAL
jgi:hypothetical protein